MKIKVSHTNGNEKPTNAVILVSDKIGFNTKTAKKAKEEHDTMIQGSVQTKRMAKTSGSLQQLVMDLKRNIDSNKITVRGSTPHFDQ